MSIYQESIIKLIKHVKAKKVIEIGVYKSRTLKKILKTQGSNIKEYWGVDPFKQLTQDTMKSWYVPQSYWDDLYIRACKMMYYFKQLKILRLESITASLLFPDHYFDLVFIDGNHEYNAISEDITMWRPKVKIGGILSGHDYGSTRHPGVKQAVDESFGKLICLSEGGVWWTDIII